MQKPASLRRAIDLPITAGLGILAAAVTALYWLTDLDLSVLMIDERVVLTEPWRLLTSALIHADPIHLAFNLYWLWRLGAIVELGFGHARTAAFYVVVALGSALAEVALFDGGVGLSGIGFGLVAFLYVLQRRDERFADAMDNQTGLLFVGWFALCVIATAMGIWQVANVAHGAGAALGAALGLFATTQGSARAGIGAAVTTAIALSIAGATALRPMVNLSSTRGSREAYDGYVALEDDRNEDARRLLLRSTELDPDQPDVWLNLGIAHARLGDDAAARRAFERGCEVAGGDHHPACEAVRDR